MKPHQSSKIGALLMLVTSIASPAFADEQRLAPAVRFAVIRAREALADPECRRIFGDFRDSSGRTLQDRLDALGSTGQHYLDSMRFYDVPDHRWCDDPRVLAMTTPGSRVVLFCGSKFSRLIRREPSLLWVTILHEELHSLGLEENPPSSEEISRQVAQRCR